MSKIIEVSDQTFEKIRDQLREDEKIEINSYEDFIGKKIFVRTVTYHLVGKVEKIVGNLMFLTGASWISDDGRFNEWIKNGDGGDETEIEPIGDWFVNINSIVDGGFWKHKLPTNIK